MRYVHSGRSAALRALGFVKHAYDLDDARKVLQAAKKYTLPSTADLGPAFAGNTALAIPASKGIKGTIRAARKFVEEVPALKSQGPELLRSLEPTGPALAPLASFTRGFTRPAIVKGDSNPARYMAKAVGATPPALTGDQHKMLHSIIRGHELDEIVTEPGMAFQNLGHRSPDVILREHNRIATLPKGYEPVKSLMQSVRGPGENLLMRTVLGPNFEYGNTPRLSRHARKRIQALLERNGQQMTQKAYDDFEKIMREASVDLGSDPGIRFEP